MANRLYYLDQIHPSDRKQVGDRAFFLSILRQRQYAVMPGVVVSADVLRQFLKEIQWLEPLFADLADSSLHLDITNSRQLQAVAQQIRQGIQTAPLNPDWLSQLYPSIQHWETPTVLLQPSLALVSQSDPRLSQRTFGLLKSRLCYATPEEVILGLKSVWSELFRARSLFYWQRSAVPLQQVNLAVLVQPLPPVLLSGDLQLHQTSLELRSTYGLGINLTEGIAVPDWYRIDPSTQQTQEHSAGSKTYCLQLPTATPETPAPPPIAPIPANPHLEIAAVESCHSQPLALTPEQLHQLIKLAQAVQSELRFPISLEWMISTHRLDDSPIITQVHPQFVEAPPAPSPPIAPRVQPAFPLSAPAEVSAGGASHAVLTGLAASPGRAIAKACVVGGLGDETTIPADVVLIVNSILPSHMTALTQAVGIVTRQGGMTSHGAILARELKIPAVVGVGQGIDAIETGEVVFVDGDRGVVYRLEDDFPLLPATTESSLAADSAVDVGGGMGGRLPTATQLLVNLSHTESLAAIARLPVDGVGLLRSELLLRPLLDRYSQQQLTQEELVEQMAQQIQQFTRAFSPRPVFYRSLDMRSHELLQSSSHFLPELNPAMGLHGTFSYQLDPTLFDIELAALRRVQQAGNGNIYLVLPFVRTVEEFRFCRQRVVQVGLTDHSQFQLWIMAEVPSILFLLPDYVQAGVQGISIGSNDLTQFILAVDRDHPQMATAFDQRHPAVLRAIQQLVQTARQHGIPCSICGQVPTQHPELIADFVRWGLSAISVSQDALEQTQRAIARAEQTLLLDTMRRLKFPSTNH
ncbi:MAG: phosphoenolpyruvate synthase [Leptolyngbyaceae cyanobacterium SL_7_1]|nr:phosphoenolpyruvate synthase [Leptolyngbyaceae cyanobacterium SL_7_1]